MQVDKRYLLLLAVLVVVLAVVYLIRAFTTPPPQFMQFPEGPRPEGLPRQMTPQGQVVSPPASGLPLPPKGGR